LSPSIIPLYAIPVGAPESADRTPPSIGSPSQVPDSGAVESDQTVTVSVEVTDEGVGVREVILSYRIDGDQTWTNRTMTTMTSISVNTYTGEISGFEEGKHVEYKILAYDSNNNLAVEDNAGKYYIYTVIPEFQNFLILIFMIATSMAIILTKTIKQSTFKPHLT